MIYCFLVIYFFEYYTNYGFSNLLEKYFLINVPFFIVAYLLALLEKRMKYQLKYMKFIIYTMFISILLNI
ncbi:hypothetical protein AMK43_02540 [Leptotrichia sp. oral taxon 212]|nr:hypothetical protein AMK43_02540 [Leptotrichia sp. oral taxon 212]